MAHYIVNAANEMLAVMSKTLEPSSEEVRQVLIIGCKTLQLLGKDEELLSSLAMLTNREKEHALVSQQIIADVNHFSRGFLQIEQRALLAAGLSNIAASYLVPK